MISQVQSSNIIGAVVAVLINLLMISLFLLRLKNIPKIEYWIGILVILNIIPLGYLFIKSFKENRPILYYFSSKSV